MMTIYSNKIRLSALSLACCIALILSLATTYSLNTLFYNNNWTVHKAKSQFTLMGSNEFFLTRVPLFQNRLNLKRYFSHQIVSTNKDFNFDSIDLDLTLPQNLFFEFFIINEQSLEGLRITKNYVSRIEGETSGKRVLTSTKAINLLKRRNLRLKIINKDQLSVTFGNQQIKLPAISNRGRIGFSCGQPGCIIDNIKIARNNKEVFEEDFRNKRGFWPLLLILLTIQIPLFLLKKENHLLLSFVLLLLSSVFYAFDYFYYSNFIHLQNGITRQLNFEEGNENVKFEVLRHRFFYSIAQLLSYDEISNQSLKRRGYPHPLYSRGPLYITKDSFKIKHKKYSHLNFMRKDTKKVLLLGSSQFFGIGGTHLDNTLNRVILNELERSINREVELLNYSISGKESKDLYIYYREFDFANSPDIMLINLGCNDDPQTLEKNLPLLIQLNQRQQIQTILLQEPTREESDSFTHNRKIMKKVAKNFKVPLLDGNQYIQTLLHKDPSHFWWDIVHLTDYGQLKYGEWIATQIKDFL